MKIERWNGDASLEILTDQIQIDGSFDLTTESRTEDKDFELGVEELHITLNSRPRLDRFAFPLEMKNLVTAFQPPLTPREIVEGCTRPDRIVNSYTLYHQHRRGNEYKAGKFGHFLRLDVHDDSGMREWCSYHIDNRLLIIEPPKRFLDRAKFPITVGELTFGKTDVGGSDGNIAENNLIGCKQTAPEAGEITKLTTYLKVDVGTSGAKGALYSDSSGNPTNLLASSAEVTIDTSWGWDDFALSYAMSNGEILWLSNFFDLDGTAKYDAGAANQYDWNNDGTYPTVPDPWGTHDQYGIEVSIYATYTTAEVEPFLQAYTRGGALRSRTSFKNTFQLD